MIVGTKNYLSEAELAVQLGRSVNSLRRWRSLGEGPRWSHVGKSPVYDPADVEAWVGSLKRDPRAKVAA
jgi:hypothetical protein